MCGVKFLCFFLYHLCKAVQTVEILVKRIHQIGFYFSILLHHQRSIHHRLRKLCYLATTGQGQHQNT